MARSQEAPRILAPGLTAGDRLQDAGASREGGAPRARAKAPIAVSCPRGEPLLWRQDFDGTGRAGQRYVPVFAVHVRRVDNDDVGELQSLDQQRAANAAMGDAPARVANPVLHIPDRIAQSWSFAGACHPQGRSHRR
jgi:hypothetical protein